MKFRRDGDPYDAGPRGDMATYYAEAELYQRYTGSGPKSGDQPEYEPGIWVTRTGQHFKIDGLPDNHLRNIVRMLLREGKVRPDVFEEAARRWALAE